MKRIRLIAVDVDGTLLDDRKRVPEENLRVLREAAHRGVLICIASGRMIVTIEAIERRLGLDCIIIGYNGGKVVGRRSEGRPLLDHRPLPADVAEVFLRFADEHSYLLNFYDGDRLYSDDGPERQPFIDLYARRTGSVYHIVENLRTSFAGVSPTKLILLAHPPERDRLYHLFRAQLGGRAIVSRTEPEYLEIMAPDADKGTSLGVLSQHYGIASDEIMAIGDAENDMGMIRAAGVGVAVANAAPDVKAAAAYVTERSNNEAGVAEAIRKFTIND